MGHQAKLSGLVSPSLLLAEMLWQSGDTRTLYLSLEFHVALLSLHVLGGTRDGLSHEGRLLFYMQSPLPLYQVGTAGMV